MQNNDYNNYSSYSNYGNYRNNNVNKKENPLWIVLLIIVFFFVIHLCFGGSNNSTSSGYGSGSSSSNVSFTKNKEDKSTYITKCSTISYSTLARNPYSYIGNDYKFTGEVIQVLNGYNNNIELRVNVTPKRYEYINETYYEDTMYVTYHYSSNYESKILEGDIITMYGTYRGIQDYVSIMGAKISIPRLDAMYIDIK